MLPDAKGAVVAAFQPVMVMSRLHRQDRKEEGQNE